jgi:hypothetical protein
MAAGASYMSSQVVCESIHCTAEPTFLYFVREISKTYPGYNIPKGVCGVDQTTIPKQHNTGIIDSPAQ